MKDLLALLAQLLTTIATLQVPGGARSIVVDSLMINSSFWPSIAPGDVHPISRYEIEYCQVSGRCFSSQAVFSVQPQVFTFDAAEISQPAQAA
jgi:hypothetical protein